MTKKPGKATWSGKHLPVGTHLWVLAPQVAVHGGPGGHLGPTELTRLSLHLLVCEVDVLLQHVLGQVLLVACGTRPRLTHCREGERGSV